MTTKLPEVSTDKRDLFAAYARFEHSLKEIGFLHGNDGGRAKPDWLKFSREKELAHIFDDLSEDSDVADLISDPPCVQMVRNGAVSWDQILTIPISSSYDLFRSVKIIRDNLFHGGKSGENPRDDALCRAATKVLFACLERRADVKAMFNGEY